jgi:type IV pili sensor histidine kinase/response regulator
MKVAAVTFAVIMQMVFGPMQAAADGTPVPGFRPQSSASAQGPNRWAALSGSTLRETLESWSGPAGWTVIWDSDLDYRLRASEVYTGGYVAAVQKLADSIHRTNPELQVTLYSGNRVVHVQTGLSETR